MTPSRKLGEERLIDELLRSSRAFADGGSKAGLASVIKTRIPGFVGKVFIVNWIPEQAEDIFTLLVDGQTIVEMEIARNQPNVDPVSFESMSVKEYLRLNPQLSKTTRRKLEMAILLSKE